MLMVLLLSVSASHRSGCGLYVPVRLYVPIRP